MFDRLWADGVPDSLRIVLTSALYMLLTTLKHMVPTYSTYFATICLVQALPLCRLSSHLHRIDMSSWKGAYTSILGDVGGGVEPQRRACRLSAVCSY